MRDQDQPQRLAPPAALGSLLKRAHDINTRLKLQRAREIAARDEAYLAMIRQCPCLKCGMDPAAEAAHIRRSSPAHGKFNGTGKKPADRHTLPLCGDCHRQDNDALHRIGEIAFFHLLGIDPLYACERLYQARGDVVAMRAVSFSVIAERG